ncbi:unnamed protein product [Porites lobata]|uniref:Amino acid transporter transmembrane domain-containing protein n=1 Tax=Porites lobata TaxID=104759 RepID=A0ABN8RZQ6_9CNID|nr:unnamed protein product [Porites lobata]
MKKETHSTGYHLLRSDPVLADELEEPPESTQEEESAEDKAAATDKSPLWKAVVNLMSSIEGTGLLALPYVIAQSGLVAIAAMAVVPFIAFYTGAILIDCLYEKTMLEKECVSDPTINNWVKLSRLVLAVP